MKICSKCKSKKSLDCFHKNTSGRSKDGLNSQCITCKSLYNKDKPKTYKGRLQRMLSNLKTRAKNKGYICSIEFEEFKDWAESKNYSAIYYFWKSSGYSLENVPTVDRIDALKPYEFSNMQIISYKNNIDKSRKEIKSNHKKVVQILKNGEEKEFSSVNQASISTGVQASNISRACNKQRKSAGGFQWRYH